MQLALLCYLGGSAGNEPNVIQRTHINSLLLGLLAFEWGHLIPCQELEGELLGKMEEHLFTSNDYRAGLFVPGPFP